LTKLIDDLFREPLNVGARQNATKGDNRSARTDTRNRQLFKFAATSPAFSSERGSATIRYIDRANMNETFADSITGLIFDGQMLRIELGVTRFDEMKPDAPLAVAAIRRAAWCCRRPPPWISSIACSRSRPR
jgi:hypothetical protein